MFQPQDPAGKYQHRVQVWKSPFPGICFGCCHSGQSRSTVPWFNIVHAELNQKSSGHYLIFQALRSCARGGKPLLLSPRGNRNCTLLSSLQIQEQFYTLKSGSALPFKYRELFSRENRFRTALNQQGSQSLPHEDTRGIFFLNIVGGFYQAPHTFSQRICLSPLLSRYHKTPDMDNMHICSEVICCSLWGHCMQWGHCAEKWGIICVSGAFSAQFQETTESLGLLQQWHLLHPLLWWCVVL